MGRRRWYLVHEEKEVELKRRSFLRERCQQQHGRDQRGRGEGGEGGEVGGGGEGGGGGVVRGKKVSKHKLQQEGMTDSVTTRQGDLERPGRDSVAAYGSVLVSGKEGDTMTLGEQDGIQSHSKYGPCAMIDEATTSRGCGSGCGAWSVSFVPRSSTEQARNCARVDRDLQQFIVQTLAATLLETEQWITTTNTASTKPSSTPPIRPSHITCCIGKAVFT